MIEITGLSKFQNIRILSDIIEPFIVAQLKRKNHTFFVYRCSDYRNYETFLKINQLQDTLIKNYKLLLEKYWTCIDVIHIKIANMPEYTPTKEYFKKLEDLRTQTNEIIDFELYEIKATAYSQLKPLLSVKTKECIETFTRLQKNHHIITVYMQGKCNLAYNTKKYQKNDFIIKTHYGRIGRNIYT